VARARLAGRTVIAAAIPVVLIGFGLGFLLGFEDSDSDPEAAEQLVTTSVNSEVPGTTSTLGRSTVTFTVPTLAPTTEPSFTTTSATPTTVAATSSTPPSGQPPPAPPPSPAQLSVSYPRNNDGTMTLPRTGVVAIQIRNDGGLSTPFVVQVVGFALVGGSTSVSGVLGPGGAQPVMVSASAHAPDEGATATVSVYDGAGLVASIPVVVA